MATPPPQNIFRYRPLSDLTYDSRSSATVFERELDALINSYIYAPQFSSMNDPMEAFYEMDTSIPLDFQGTVRSILDRFALTSFTDSSKNILMWAYYASSFFGMCLEFDRYELNNLSQFKNEPLLPINYSNSPPPRLCLNELTDPNSTVFLKMLCTKRNEWRHESEWRLLAGTHSKRYYADSSLKRVYLGPRVSDMHARKICDALKNRSTQVLQGHVKGYDLSFEVVQNGLATVSEAHIKPKKAKLSAFDLSDVMGFINQPIAALERQVFEILNSTNTYEIMDIIVGGSDFKYVSVITKLTLRNNAVIYHNFKFNADLEPIYN